MAAADRAEIGRAAGALGAARAARRARRRWLIGLLCAAIAVAFAGSLLFGQTAYSPATVVRVLLGQDAGEATFAVGRLRLPRAVVGVLTGFCFGLGGAAFQTMLRNPLASPDIIGISAGASTAGAFGIIVLSLGAAEVSVFAIAAGLLVALAIYLLSYRGGVVGTRLILIGIGVGAMLNSLTGYVLSQADQWDLPEANRWLTGSLNNAQWQQALPVAVALVVLAPVLLGQSRNLAVSQLGDEAAAGLGVNVTRTRLIVVVAAVGLVAFGTAAAGPIAFVAFLSGPIVARLLGPHSSPLLPAGLVGALLVLLADFAGQHLLGLRLPVGVVTGVLGAPYLIYLIVRSNRTGGGL
ncbi:FecCD family ABC transporter permease [Nakamurella aerolata]|uniref:FecCD family ABC transporter permease n=1 Tax=Nakamurella aerolata TaxID=1656892 RepID=UPI003CCDB5A7